MDCGIQAIHEAVWTGHCAVRGHREFDGMPRAAIETGVVSYVLPPIPRWRKSITVSTSPSRPARPCCLGRRSEWGRGRLADGDRLLAAPRPVPDRFRTLQVGHGLECIDRRATMTQSIDLDDYARRLSTDTHELSLLYHDLLIGVTQFFRYLEAFHFVQRRILPMLSEQVVSGGLRIGVPGCATGEEAYSLAILFHEAAEQTGRPLNFKVVATDVHEESLSVAASGMYTAESVLRVSPDCLQRYFVQRGSDYQVTKELRQSIGLQPDHRDAPFTCIDLISCRNLLDLLRGGRAAPRPVALPLRSPRAGDHVSRSRVNHPVSWRMSLNRWKNTGGSIARSVRCVFRLTMRVTEEGRPAARRAEATCRHRAVARWAWEPTSRCCVPTMRCSTSLLRQDC